ncbi:MAG: hypothetical protein LBT46_04250 [Planctomycetaceae bacterium]|jgi:hypothetical protein|nr:hypothetical protein [Planctomycetaceae bacterium]
MTRNAKKTIAAGLGGLLVLGFSFAHAADAPKQVPRVQHEMVPHIVLPETIQYKKTAKTVPDGAHGSISPYVASYTPFPSYQVPYSAEFRSVGQSVYPVSPELLPEPLPEVKQPEADRAERSADIIGDVHTNYIQTTVTENLKDSGRDISLTDVAEPIQLAADNQELIPILPDAGGIEQTGIFCQHPAKTPTAWSFSSPICKVASVPNGFGNGQGYISQNGLRGSNQQIAFQPAGLQPAGVQAGTPQPGTPADANAGAAAQGIPYSTFQLGNFNGQEQYAAPQAQVLPNGMILLTLPPDHNRCGILRCRSGASPRTLLLPPSSAFGAAPAPVNQAATFMPSGNGFAGYPQAAMMNPMMPNPVFNPADYMSVAYQPQILQMQLAQTPQAAPAETEGKTADNKDAAKDGQQQQVAVPNAGGLLATPYGYVAVQTLPQQAMLQQVMPQQAIQNPAYNPYGNPYGGFYATPYGYVAVGQPQIQPIGGGMTAGNMNMMMGGMMPQQPAFGYGFPAPSQNVTIADLALLLSQMNNQNHRRGLFERVAERREERRKNRSADDPMAQLCQSWATPYISPETSLRMPSRNAYPYGYFGAQALPVSTANYGGYHNLSFGNTMYPGLY